MLVIRKYLFNQVFFGIDSSKNLIFWIYFIAVNVKHKNLIKVPTQYIDKLGTIKFLVFAVQILKLFEI
jgi:hypothetical protein